jgi:1-acyl-sn-glycerol-3-phosphate acyltransferase
MLTSLILAVVLPAYTFAAGLVGIPYAFLTGDARILFWLSRFGVRIGFALARIRIVTHGLEKISAGSHFIYMMNHNSNLDAPAVFLKIPGPVRILAKKELFRLPVLATAMRMGGFVPVDRSNREAAIESARSAARIAASGSSFLIAPEGTRSRTGDLLPFKKGGFHIAIDSRVPVVPITVVGAFELMPPGSFGIRPGTIEIFFHDPIATTGLQSRDRFELIARVRAPMEEVLARHRAAPVL